MTTILVDSVQSRVSTNFVWGLELIDYLWVVVPHAAVRLLVVNHLIGSGVVIDILGVHVHRLVVGAADADDEAYEQSNGVKDIDEASQSRNAEYQSTGDHHAICEIRVIHDL